MLIFATTVRAVFELIHSTNLKGAVIVAVITVWEIRRGLLSGGMLFLLYFVVCSHIIRPPQQQSGVVVAFIVSSVHISPSPVWIKLATSIWAFAALYLQLHSWVDCIEPLNPRNYDCSKMCIWMYFAITLPNNISSCPKYSSSLLKIAGFQTRTYWSEEQPAVAGKNTCSPVFSTVGREVLSYRNWSVCWLELMCTVGLRVMPQFQKVL